MIVPAGTPAPRPVLDTILDLVLDAPRMLNNGHTRESIRVWLYDRVDAVSGGPPPPLRTMADHPVMCRCNACTWEWGNVR